MKAVAIAVLAACTLMVGACATTQSPVPVAGDATNLGRLAGEWGGEYQGPSRSGSIVFKLAAGADTAFGDVVMIPRERRESRLPQQDPSAGLATPRSVEVLRIAFVRAADGGLSGRLAPYRDPDCDCILNTRFEGRFRGDAIEGTFTSTPEGGGTTQSGTWKVSRRKT